MAVSSYNDLLVWQKSMALAKQVYDATKAFPRDELYALTNQVRRAAVSVPSNIAEGHARDSTKEFLHHLSIALGSLAEVETQLILSQDLQYLPNELLAELLNETSELGRMIRGLQKSLQRKLQPLAPSP
jgi:four helix bundle protein